jgi:hypothetical protein
VGFGLTNANKAAVIVAINALLILVQAFFPEAMSDQQRTALEGFVNALLGAWVAVTYKDSPKRIENEQLVAAIKDVDPPAEVLVTEDEPS